MALPSSMVAKPWLWHRSATTIQGKMRRIITVYTIHSPKTCRHQYCYASIIGTLYICLHNNSSGGSTSASLKAAMVALHLSADNATTLVKEISQLWGLRFWHSSSERHSDCHSPGTTKIGENQCKLQLLPTIVHCAVKWHAVLCLILVKCNFWSKIVI